ncbi:glutathione S-transferase, partial [Escherichia coli]|nr:glutathione S-transferase [Escherichia coli]
LVLFQTLAGVSFAFPRCVKTLKESGKHDKVWALHERVKEREKIKAYLESSRRQQYSQGIYRHYRELDDE